MKARDVTGAPTRVATKSRYKVSNVHPISRTMGMGTEPDVYLSNCPKQFRLNSAVSCPWQAAGKSSAARHPESLPQSADWHELPSPITNQTSNLLLSLDSVGATRT